VIVAAGSTDVTTYFLLTDPVTGGPAGGLTITDLDLTYVRDRSAAVKNDAAALASADADHADNQAIEVDAANAPGVYRVDWPDAAFAAGASKVQLYVRDGSASPGCRPACVEVALDAGAHVLAEDVDSTGTPVSAAKAIEAILAVVAGNATFDRETGAASFKGRDGTTEVAANTVAGVGTRTGSAIT
jgi:hypothetical protein